MQRMGREWAENGQRMGREWVENRIRGWEFRKNRGLKNCKFSRL